MARKITTEIFIEDAKKIHGDKYSYEFVEYVNGRTDVKIYCCQCSKYFYQRPDLHKQGRGCPICGRRKSNESKMLSNKDFINKANKIHKNKYSYGSVDFKGTSKKVKIFCKTCNKYFWQIASNHLSNHGCPDCAVNNKRVLKLTTADFIDRAKKIHGDKYSYKNSIYKGYHTKLEIYCNRCKEVFFQEPANHLSGSGHTKCGHCSFSPTEYGDKYKKSILYVVNMFGMDESFYKIGITSEGIEKRFRRINDYNYEVWYEKELSGYEARQIEINLHRLHRQYKHYPFIKFKGHTECFSRIDLPLIKQTINKFEVGK